MFNVCQARDHAALLGYVSLGIFIIITLMLYLGGYEIPNYVMIGSLVAVLAIVFGEVCEHKDNLKVEV